jgi:uncharacterized membrane protein
LGLVVVVFDSPTRADKAVYDLRQLKRSGVLRIEAVAVLRRDTDGKASFVEMQDLRGPEGALLGTLGGFLLGALIGPAGAVAGAVLGAAGGGAAAALIDRGFPDETLRQLQHDLVPGSSALLALVEGREGTDVSDALRHQPIIATAPRVWLIPDADLRRFKEQLEQAQTSLLGTPLGESPK